MFEIVLEFGSHLNRTTTFNWEEEKKEEEPNQRLPNLMDFVGREGKWGELRKCPRRDALL